MASTPTELLRAMRPNQWTKNVFVLAPLVFAQKMADATAVGVELVAFAVFCVLSSSVYLVNDIFDREADRLHPTKRNRPIAAGRLTPNVAGAAAAVLGAIGVGGAVALGTPFAAVAIVYVAMNFLYSAVLKRVVILDVMLISAGFLLRAWAGAVAIRVVMSHWLVLCTGLIALFLGFVKRRQEISSLGDAAAQRPILREYSLPFLDQMIAIVTASTILAYSLYAFSSEVAEKLGTRWMGLTIPFVVFGIFRYLYLVHQRDEGQNPSAVILKDPPLLGNILLWGGTVILALYLGVE